jgi:hypothetical protein
VSFKSRLTFAFLCAVCGIMLLLGQWRPLPTVLVGPCSYASLAILPGLALVAWLRRDVRSIGSQAAALGLGPVVSGSAVALLMLFGLSSSVAVAFAGLAFSIAAATGVGWSRGGDSPRAAETSDEKGRYAWLIAVAAVALVAVFPLLGEGWRLRSDAWFHVAVVFEIENFGLPPTDPFFSGLPLQYMWLYHIYTGGLAEAAGIDPPWAMVCVNLQAIACLVLATFALSSSLRGRTSGAALSSAFILIGMNGLFWVFLPFKLVRTLVGDVRGWDELVRQLSLFSLHILKMRAFVSVWKSQPFLLDKFIVATAFSLGLCLSVVFALFAFRYIANGRASAGALAACAMAGIALYHTPTAVAFGGAAGLALVATALTSSVPYRRRALVLVAWLGAAALLTAPYLYNVAGAKESSQFFPLGLSPLKIGCIFVSCATAFLLAGPSIVRFLRSRRSPLYFYGLFAAGALIVGLVLILPGPNTYDKTPYFVFLPLAPVAGWGIQALFRGRTTPLGRSLTAIACVAAIMPSTAFVYAAYLSDPGRPPTSPEDEKLYAWVRENTPRDAVFLDNHDRVGMPVLGPRRLLWGRESYADQWGYNVQEMEARKGLRDRVYSEKKISRADCEQLSEYGEHVYVIVRNEDYTGGRAPGLVSSTCFSLAYSAGGISLYRVVPARAAPD